MKIIDKIFCENPIIINDIFHIVEDKYPICDKHLMLFHKKRIKSLSSEFQSVNLQLFFDEFLSYYREDFYFFERGNASFCTSLNEETCSHIHILPKKYFSKDLIQQLCAYVDSFGIIKDSIIVTESEYFFFGDINKSYFVELNKIPQKHFFRDFFNSMKLNNKEYTYAGQEKVIY